MATCPACGQDVPAHMKHLPSRSTDGAEFGTCFAVAVDRNGRTAREAAEWARLQRAARRGEPSESSHNDEASEASEGVVA